MAERPSTSWAWLPGRSGPEPRLCNRRIFREGPTVGSAAEKSIIRLSQPQHKDRINVIREEPEKDTASGRASRRSPRFPELSTPRCGVPPADDQGGWGLTLMPHLATSSLLPPFSLPLLTES